MSDVTALESSSRIIRTPDGRAICVAEYGDPSGAPILSFHGTPGCRLLSAQQHELGFEPLIRDIGVRLIRYDRPGYGRSDRRRGRQVVDTAEDVATITDALGIDRLAVHGGSAGAHHALAAAAVLSDRMSRVAAVAPMAPYAELGYGVWTAGQDAGVKEYIGWVLDGEDTMAVKFPAEDANEKRDADPDDPRQASVFEQTRDGIGGWVDDEAAAMRSWGFDPASITTPTAIWYDPDERVLPHQHAEWLAARIPGAELIVTKALGHGSPDDPVSDWRRLYAWLAGGA
jgi:pimeloyl-ACP methyl ester carboxylesterase